MKLHEFQAKRLLSAYGIPCPTGEIAISAEEAEAAARRAGADEIFVKAQILAGGRGIAGGVRAVQTPSAAKAAAKALLGNLLVTRQTGPAGQVVRRVLVEPGISCVQQLYLALAVSDVSGELELIGGPHFSDDFEDRERSESPKLRTLLLDSKGAALNGNLAAFCAELGIDRRRTEDCAAIVRNMHRAFVELDASLIEMNPLGVTETGLVVLDAKMVLDDNALFRHPDLAELRDRDEIDEIELDAQRHQINYVRMDGDIGIIANGAGLGLATVDMVSDAGGHPANFMDIRTTAKTLDIAHGVGLVLDNPKAKVLLVNVYGGGMQPCDTIIDALAIAIRRKGRVLPIILRFTGNNENMARTRLGNFNLPTTEYPDMRQAVTAAVAVARKSA